MRLQYNVVELRFVLTRFRELDRLEAHLELMNVRNLTSEEIFQLGIDGARLPDGSCRFGHWFRLTLLILIFILLIRSTVLVIVVALNHLSLLEVLVLLILQGVNLIRVHLLITSTPISSIF